MNPRIHLFPWLALALFSLLLSLPYVHTCGDDSFIYFRLIENFLSTGRLEYNPGEPCYAMTSVTFFFTMAELVRWLGLTGGRYAISLIGHFFAVGALYALGRRLIRTRAVLGVVLAAILLDPFYLRWFWAGWEMSFKIGAAALALWALLRAGESGGGRWGFLAGLAAGFAVLTRPEMLFLTVLGALYLAVRRVPFGASGGWRTLSGFAAGWLLLAGPWMLFAQSYFGWALPHTVYAKAGGFATLAYLQGFLVKFLQILFVPALPVYGWMAWMAAGVRPVSRWLACARKGWMPDPRDRLLVALWASMVAGYLIRGVYIDGIKIGLFSPFVILTAGALGDSAMRLQGREWKPWMAGCGILILVLLSVGVQSRLFYRYACWNPRYAGGDDAGFIEFAKRVKARTPPDARIGIAELGVVGYFSGRYMIDYVGLATPQLVTYQMETGSKLAAVQKYYELHGGPASHVVQEFRFNPVRAPATCDFWGYSYRLIDSERVARIAGRARKGEYSIYGLYERIPDP